MGSTRYAYPVQQSASNGEPLVGVASSGESAAKMIHKFADKLSTGGSDYEPLNTKDEITKLLDRNKEITVQLRAKVNGRRRSYHDEVLKVSKVAVNEMLRG